MAQHESRSPKNRVYNQFNSGGDLKELPNYSADKKNGWGLFQRDDTAGGIYVDTQQVYNWQSNTQVFYQEMIEKQAAQQRFFNAVAAAYPNIPAAQSPPSGFTFPGTITAMTALEAGTITLSMAQKNAPNQRWAALPTRTLGSSIGPRDNGVTPPTRKTISTKSFMMK